MPPGNAVGLSHTIVKEIINSNVIVASGIKICLILIISWIYKVNTTCLSECN